MSIKGDLIAELPEDSSSRYDEKLANMLFKEKKAVNSVFKEFKESILIAVLFVIFSSGQFDKLLYGIYPSIAYSPLMLTGVKCLIIILLYYLLKNFEFSRAK